MKFSVVPAF